MRSERLLGIVAALQRRGRVTAPELAEYFEVSVKTIQRDMEALSRAGVPVFASRGAGGGWELLADYRSSLTGLTSAEALAIVVGRPQSLLADLGVADAGEMAIDKLLGTLGPEDRQRATRARERLLVDPELWSFAGEDEPFLPELYQAVSDDLLVLARYGDAKASREIGPLGLVLKRDAWYLVGSHAGHCRTYRVGRVRELHVTSRRFERPHGFDLARYWAANTTDYTESLPSYRVELRLRAEALQRLPGVPVKARTVGTPGANGWAKVELEFLDPEGAAAGIRLLGGEVKIVAPADLRHRVLDEARAVIRANRQP